MLNRKGQNIAEYSILIALVIAAAVAMNTYVKRGLQGRIHEAVKHAGVTGAAVGQSSLTFTGDQYEPYYASSDTTQSSSKTASESTDINGKIDKTSISETMTVASGSKDTTLSTTGAD